MPLFVIERQFAERLDPTPEVAKPVNAANAEAGVRWLYSFLSSDHRKTYCIYEAPDPEALREAARRAGIPADVIVELDRRIENDGRLAEILG